ncbi:MAG TPA: SpoIID/LytB domain-containing protein [Ilumatobacter sp.]|nr:SpoIID/LytB domain-containing protein [Ilumatobacter sp.]
MRRPRERRPDAPRLRSATGLAVLLALAPGLVSLPGGAPAAAAPAGDDAVVAFVVNGVGNGHGRGLSQWGSYGRALDGQSYTDILAAYYGGTVPGTRPGAGVRVRLTKWDGAGSVGVMSASGAATWNGVGYRSLMAVETAANTFTVYGSTTDTGCPSQANLVVPRVTMQQGASGESVRQLQRLLNYFGADPQLGVDGQFGALTATAVSAFQASVPLAATGVWDAATWAAADARLEGSNGGTVAWATLATGVTGPVQFTTTVAQTGAAGDVLGLCTAGAGVVHYRGSIEFVHTGDGNRVVNALSVESYLRGVVPNESPAYWGDGGGGKGMHALRAQSVAARSFALSQGRYPYAGTCDTSSCQVYYGAASRASATSGVRPLEKPQTDQAIADTAGQVREWASGERAGQLVSTEYSASNGPRTAGGAFPPVDDPWDDQPGNPNHRWTRIIAVDRLASRYGLSRADAIRTAADPGSQFAGIWANQVALGDGRTVSAWDFRNAFSLPAPGFELVPITRTTSSASTFAYLGDSVGEGIAGSETGPLRVLLDGVHASQHWNSRGSRPTGGGSDSGVHAAGTVPEHTDLVVVELGYNDSPSLMPARIDAVMDVLRARGVGQVLWVTVSERRTNYDYAATNAAIRAAAGRWPELAVIDWKAASDHAAATRWYTGDGVHLTTTGNAEFSLWLRQQILEGTARPVAAGSVYRVPVLGLAGLPDTGVAGVALNVTAVAPAAPGWLRVWDCAADEPDTSSVNYMSPGAVEPNAVVVPLGVESAEVCVRTKERTHVIVDVAGSFPVDDEGAGVLRAAAGRVSDTRETTRVPAQGTLRVPVLGKVGVPGSGVAGVALNVTAVDPVAAGWLRVWDCAAREPDTSSVNYMAPGAVEPNAVVVPFAAGSTGEVCVKSLVESDVIVDVAGWFAGGVRAAAGRAVDTRDGVRVGARGVLRVPLLGVAGVPAADVAGVALNVTAVDPVAAGWLRVWDCAAREPDTSSVNYLAGGTEPNAVIVPFADDSAGEVCVRSLVSTDVIVDVAGWFDSGVAPAAGRIADTRYGLGPLPN